MKIYVFIVITLLNSSIAKAQYGTKPEQKERLENWIYESARAGDFYEDQISVVMDAFQELHDDPVNRDLFFNLAKEIHFGLNKLFKTNLVFKDYNKSSKELINIIEYLYSFGDDGSERTYIMLGMLENDRKHYLASLYNLKKGLENENEGSEYWMIAADQYLLAGFKIGSTSDVDDFIEIYKKFQYYVNQSKDKYYTERLQMYIPYYEPKL